MRGVLIFLHEKSTYLLENSTQTVYIIKYTAKCHMIRGGNRVGFGFGFDGSGQFDFLEEIGLSRVG
jgi:hypothetical protein